MPPRTGSALQRGVSRAWPRRLRYGVAVEEEASPRNELSGSVPGAPQIPHDHTLVTIGSGPPGERRALFDELIGRGGWIKAVRALTMAGDLATLEALATQEHPVLELIRSEHHQGIGQPHLGRDMATSAGAHDLERACRAAASLGGVLIDPTRQDLRERALTWFRRAPIATDPAETEAAFARSSAAPFIEALRTAAAEPPPFAVALASHLGGESLPTSAHVQVTVLFDAGIEGHTGRLHLTSVPSMGPALLPDPATMALFRADDRFAASVRQAWALRRSRHGTLWTLEDPYGAIDAVTGGSLGAAFAMALDELQALSAPGRRLVRLKRLGSPEVAVTGDIAPTGRLIPVGGLDTKLSAAAASTIRRVVIPAEPERPGAHATASGSKVEVITAASLDDVLREVRRVDRRALARTSLAVLAVLTVLLGAVGLSAVHSRDQTRDELATSQRKKEAKGLLVKAGQLRATDLRASLLLTLESYKLDPVQSTRNQLTEALGVGTSLRKVLPAPGRPIAVEAIRPVDEEGWESAVLDEEGTITYRSVDTGKLLATTKSDDSKVTAIAANPLVPWLVTEAGNTFRQIAVPTRRGTETVPSLSPSTCDGDSRPLLAISRDGTLAAAAQDSTVCIWNLLTGERTAAFSPSQLPIDRGAKADGPTAPSNVTAVAFGTESDTLLLGERSAVARIDLETWHTEVLPFNSGFDATSLAAYRDETDGTEHLLTTAGSQLFVKFPDQHQFEAVSLAGRSIRRIDANVDGSYVLATFDDGVRQLDPSQDFQPSTAPDALTYRSASTARADVALVDSYPPTAVAVLEDLPAILVGGRRPVQQRATLDDYATGVSASADGSTVVTFTETSATAQRLDPHTNKSTGTGRSLDVPSQIAGNQVRLRDVTFPEAAHGDFIVWGYTYVGIDQATVGVARVFDGKTLQPKKDLQLPSGPHRQLVSTVDAGKDEVFVDISGHATTFDTRSWKRRRTQRLPLASPYATALSPSGRVLAVSDIDVDSQGRKIQPAKGSVSFFQYPSLTPIGAPVPSPGGATWSLGFLDDTTVVASAIDNQLYRFDAHRTAGGTTRWQAKPLHIGGSKAVSWFGISPDRSHLAIARGADISIFGRGNLDTAESVLSTGDDDVVLFLFAGDNRSMITQTKSTTAIWTLPTGDLEAQVCRVVGAGLTRAEWRHLMPGVTYTRRCHTNSDPAAGEASPDTNLGGGTSSDWLEESDADSIPVVTATCKDFASVQPANCVVYGPKGKPYALVSTEHQQDGVTSATITSWSARRGRWEALGQTEDPYSSVEMHPIDVSPGPPQVVMMYIPGNYDITLVLDRGKVVFDTGLARLSGTDLITDQPIDRGQQPRAGIDGEQRWVHRWNGSAWTLIDVAPGPSRFWPDQRKLLAPDLIAGIRLGQAYAAAVGAVQRTMDEIGPNGTKAILRHWRDGLSQTATQPWTAREPEDLDETCWARQLCVYGDSSGAFVGWRYDSGRVGSATGTTASTADHLRLQESHGLELVDDWQDVHDQWPEGSLVNHDGFESIQIGVTHPRGALAPAAGSPAPLVLDPLLAGAADRHSVSAGNTPITLGFDPDVQASWTTSKDQISFTRWDGDGSVAVWGPSMSDGTQPLGVLPGPGTADWSLTVCTTGKGVALSATGEGKRRAWLVTQAGLVQRGADKVC